MYFFDISLFLFLPLSTLMTCNQCICMLFGVETLDTHDMSNKHIYSNFFVVLFYLTLITSHFILTLLDSILSPKCVKIYVLIVKSFDSSEVNHCSSKCHECR